MAMGKLVSKMDKNWFKVEKINCSFWAWIQQNLALPKPNTKTQINQTKIFVEIKSHKICIQMQHSTSVNTPKIQLLRNL